MNNYAKLLYELLKIAIEMKGVNFAGQGDVEEINNLTIKDFPVFWLSATQPQTEYENYIDYHLTFNYIDREKVQTDDVNDTDRVLIHNNGMTVISNVIRKFIEEKQPMNEVYPIDYNLWSDTQMFNDVCNGVWTDITLRFPKVSNCVVE